jgi:lipopolysaccharide assembly outer membrane protein LptD (OstA)
LLVDVGGGSISRFSTRLDYRIAEDWKVFAGYFYQNDYTQRSVYSMGSSLTDITSGSSFTRTYGKRQSIFGGLEFPIIDDKTRGTVSMYYDLDDNMINEARVGVIRKFHCWEAGVEWRVKERNDDVGEREWENTFMFTVSLTDLPSVKIAAKGGPSN